jgi:sulfonate transport system permease protein
MTDLSLASLDYAVPSAPAPPAKRGAAAPSSALRALRALAPWAAPAALVAVWQLSSSLGWTPNDLLPSPSDVISAGVRLTLSGELPANIAISAKRAIVGFALGGGIAFLFGLSNGLSRRSELLTDTTFQMARNIPNLALIPLVILWLGVDEGAKIFLTAFGVFFPVYVNTLHGVRNVDPQLIEMARSYGLGRLGLFRQVVLPGAAPSIFVGLRYGLGIMWLTLIVSETIAAQSGLGHMAMQAREFMLVDVVILAIVLYALLGKLADATARALERRALAWNPAYAAPRGAGR